MARAVPGRSSRRNDVLVHVARRIGSEDWMRQKRMWDFGTASIWPTFGRICLIIAILSVVTVFLAPSGFGPYSAVNGPTTVFKSIQHADAVKAAVCGAVLLSIRPLVSMIHGLRIVTSSSFMAAWIGILKKYCVRLC